MTRIDAPLVRSTSLVETNPTSTSDSSFQLVARSGTPASASSTSAAGSLVAPAPLGARRDPADVFADTNVMTISQSGPISITLDGKNAQYDNGLMVLKLDERGAVIGVDPVFADSTNPGKSVSMDVRKGDRIAFVAFRTAAPRRPRAT